jgi:alcohol dehydrogenase
MQAVIYHGFGEAISLATVDDPSPQPDGAVVRVEATGLCRSDWHGWRGHDPDIKRFPHVPGHEFAGTVVAVGNEASPALVGQRVTMPFVAGCGRCGECRRGNQHICDHQFQPGFTGWGSFAEYVSVRYANGNLVILPERMPSVTAAAMGCRLGTAYRAVSVQGGVRQGVWVAVHGCGGVGLSAVMVACALGARVVAVDIRAEPLSLAQQLGAEIVLNASETTDVAAAILDISAGGVDVSLDALGSPATLTNSVLSLRKRGRHVQVGLLTDRDAVPAAVVQRLIAWELEIAGSHGIQAHIYPEMFGLIRAGKLDPTLLVDRTMSLDSAPRELASLDEFRGCGVTVFTPNVERAVV